MKTLRLFFATMILLFLAVGISSAQGNKTVTTITEDWESPMVCTDDYVTGVETYIYTNWDGKVQIRAKGTYTGLTGKTYTWNWLSTFTWKDFVEGTAINATYVVTSILECEGVPIAILKRRFHSTTNANGEVTVEFVRNSEGWECL